MQHYSPYQMIRSDGSMARYRLLRQPCPSHTFTDYKAPFYGSTMRVLMSTAPLAALYVGGSPTYHNTAFDTIPGQNDFSASSRPVRRRQVQLPFMEVFTARVRLSWGFFFSTILPFYRVRARRVPRVAVTAPGRRCD